MPAQTWDDATNTHLDDIAVHLGSPQYHRVDSPEMRLQWAVLQDVIDLIRTSRTIAPHDWSHCMTVKCGPCQFAEQVAEAERWLTQKPNGWPFSFGVICETWGLNPSAVRVAVLQWTGSAVAYHRRKIQLTGSRPVAVGGTNAFRQSRRRTERLAKVG